MPPRCSYCGEVSYPGAGHTCKGLVMNEELKPCPFCGSENIEVEDDNFGTTFSSVWLVECLTCGVRSATDERESSAIKGWNARPIEDALRAELAAATKIIRDCQWAESSQERDFFCPICHWSKAKGHSDNCRLGKWLIEHNER